jgi:hypothetical protein
MKRVGGHLGGWRGPALLLAAAVVAVGLAIRITSGPAGQLGSEAAPRTAGGNAVAAASEPTAARRSGARTGAKGTRSPNATRSERAVIRLLAGSFDPLSDPLPAQRGIALVDEASLTPEQPQYWLMQVRDERFPDALRAVRAAGGMVAGAVRDDAYVVRATPEQRERIARAQAVRWTGYFQPAWRVPGAAQGKRALLDLVGTRTYRVRLFRDDPNPSAVGRALAAMPGVEIVSDSGVVVDVRATAAQIPAIAALPAVQWIGIKPRVVAHNVNARWVNDTGVRDVYAATAVGRLTGAGQTAAVADSGLNYTYDLNGRAHIGFRDCNPDGTGCKEAIYTQLTPGNAPEAIDAVENHGTGHRKMVAYFDLGDAGPNMFDESSHGSHTAGSVAGDQPPFDAYTGSDGLAPAANHVHQNIATKGGSLGGLPGDDYDLWRQAYRPRDPASVLESSEVDGNPADYTTNYIPTEDARTHNNSYGLLAPVIDEGSAEALDRFVWDHEDMTIVVSAGNAGPNPGTIGSPSVAKNELSSGASANGRQPMVSIDSMAAFSSHGPTGDGRFGVDLATPGQIVVSVKGGSTDGYHTAQGTSMSGPVLTGLATLVRQYFYDGYGPAGGDGFAGGGADASRKHNPSAALVKAALINGAVRMRGFYTGTAGGNRQFDGEWPSGGQGFGRVSLDNSLYFANDPTNNWYRDVYRGDADAFPASALTATRTYQIHVEPGQPLDVTLSYTDAPDLLPAGTPALVNNLDLTVTGPGGTYVGNNMNSRTNPGVNVAETPAGPSAPDVSNLSERIRIAAPAAGDYTITVTAAPILFGNQGFALAASGKISPVGGPAFVPGPPLQTDQAGNPAISNVRVDTLSANTAKIYFDTNEPTTATATIGPNTFVDSYNVGSGGFTGLDEATVETSSEYGDKPVVGTKHEILVTGLAPGQNALATLDAKDLAGNEVSHVASFTSPTAVFQADADDTGQLYEDAATAAQAGNWRTGTQLYASDSGAGDGVLGAFMFRIPQAAVNPADITGAVVELTSAHNWVVPYTDDRQLKVDLLESTVEGNWGTQNYSQIHNARFDARVFPETTYRRGDYQKYAFTFPCSELQALKNTLAAAGSDRLAAFRYESTVDPHPGFFSMDFGFNRRSRGPDLRPKLILFTAAQTGYPDGRPCDPATPAPTIREVGIHDGHSANAVTVSWETDVDSNSLVLFREDGATDWIQVGTPALTKVHQVEVFGLDRSKEYEFAVRSTACNGATTTDVNGGAGYDFFHEPTPKAQFYFHGLPQDQANKTAGPPYPAGSLTFDSTAPTETVPVVQTTTWGALANQDFVGNQLGAFWVGSFPTGPIDREIEIRWYWSSQSPSQVAFGQNLDITVFADPSFTGSRVQPEKVIGRARVDVNLGFTPTLNISKVHVTGAVQQTLMIQVFPVFGVGSEGLQITYDSVTEASGFSYLLAEPPNLPLVGPVPPPSAEESGLAPPPTRTGPATDADVAAGTGICNMAAPNQPPIAGNDSATTQQDTPVTVDVLANDADPDRDPLDVTGATDPAHGSTVVNANETITYTPDPGYFGPDTFQYTISDGHGGSDTADVSITVVQRVARGPDLQVTEIDFSNNRSDDDDDFDDDGKKDDEDDDDDDDGRGDDADDDDDNDKRRDGKARQRDKVTITATIANTGRERAGASKTEFVLDGSVVLGLEDTPSIPAGGKRKVSVVWDTRTATPGEHTIKVTADKANQVNETNETNNERSRTYTVQANQVRNGSFEDDDDDDDEPDDWERSSGSGGSTSWSDGGSHGQKSASTTGNGGSAAAGSPTWTSAPIAVTPGALMDLELSVSAKGASSPGRAVLVYLGPLGNVLDRVTLLTTPLATTGFSQVEEAVTIPAGVARVQIVLAGFAPTDLATAGTVTFDDVGLFAR